MGSGTSLLGRNSNIPAYACIQWALKLGVRTILQYLQKNVIQRREPEARIF